MKFVQVCISIICLFNACNSFDKKWNSKKTKWNTFVVKGAFVVQYPDYLVQDSMLSPLASMAFDNKAKEIYCMIIRESRDTLRYLGYDSMNLPDYIDLIKQNRDTSLIFKVLNEKKAKVNGLNAIEWTVKYYPASKNDGQMISKSRQLIIEGRKGFFQIYIWCLSKDFEENKEDFKKIISSFREL